MLARQAETTEKDIYEIYSNIQEIHIQVCIQGEEGTVAVAGAAHSREEKA
jgi:hypothetical protein